MQETKENVYDAGTQSEPIRMATTPKKRNVTKRIPSRTTTTKAPARKFKTTKRVSAPKRVTKTSPGKRYLKTPSRTTSTPATQKAKRAFHGRREAYAAGETLNLRTEDHRGICNVMRCTGKPKSPRGKWCPKHRKLVRLAQFAAANAHRRLHGTVAA